MHAASALSPPGEVLSASLLVEPDEGRAAILRLCSQPRRSGWLQGEAFLSSAVGGRQGQTADGRTSVIRPQGLLVVLTAHSGKSRLSPSWGIEAALPTAAVLAPAGAEMDVVKPPGLWRRSECRPAGPWVSAASPAQAPGRPAGCGEGCPTQPCTALPGATPEPQVRPLTWADGALLGALPCPHPE